jgi:hypothetical protein
MRASERQKEPSIALIFCKLPLSCALSRQRSRVRAPSSPPDSKGLTRIWRPRQGFDKSRQAKSSPFSRQASVPHGSEPSATNLAVNLRFWTRGRPRGSDRSSKEENGFWVLKTHLVPASSLIEERCPDGNLMMSRITIEAPRRTPAKRLNDVVA